MRKLTKAHRLKIGAASAARWAALPPEERASITEKGRLSQMNRARIKREKQGKSRQMVGVPSFFLDPDFDEGL